MRETIDYAAERSWWAEGDHPLDPRERERVGRALEAGEDPGCFARGRLDGRTLLWVATARRLVEIGMGWFGRTVAVPLTAIEGIEAEEGAHGWTIRVAVPGGRRTLIAVSPSLGRPFLARLEEATGRTVSFLPSRRARAGRLFVSRMGVDPSPQTASLAPARDPAPAVADHTAVALTAALRDAADLHQRGALSDEEFAALKRRLLGG
jgi:hypothetical protein